MQRFLLFFIELLISFIVYLFVFIDTFLIFTIQNKPIMLELCKEILLKVSFDKLLFQKELNKALRWISNSDEKESLKKWCYSKFGKEYPEVIKLAFVSK